MFIINIFIASIVALGFWKISSKDEYLQIANATLTKTVIFFVLTVALTFFYIKTYQVATFNNSITVRSFKGAFDIERIINDQYKDTLNNYIPHDKISKIQIFNIFSNKRLDLFDPLRGVCPENKAGGIRVVMDLDNTRDSTIIVSNSNFNGPSNLTELRCCYDFSLMMNSIPSLFPFSAYEESLNNDFFTTEKDSMNIESFSKNISREDDVFGVDYDKMYGVRLSTKERKRSIEQSVFSERFNYLNFFSAADLSQCQFMFSIRTEIPIDQLSVYFDIPIEVTSGNIIQDEFDSRSFSVKLNKHEDWKRYQFAFYHIKFPTLSNLQLIRSLILTTLLTILYSLLFSNLYYYGRKEYKRYIKKHSVEYKKKKEILLLWIPAGKIIVWTIIILMVYLLLLSIFNNPIVFDAKYIIPIKLLFFFILILYCILVYIVLYVLYKRGIYMKAILWDLKTHLRQINLNKYIQFLISKYAKHSHHRKDGGAD